MDWTIYYILSTIGIFLTFFALLAFLPFCVTALICFIKNQGIKIVTIVGGFLAFCIIFGISTFGYYSLGGRGGGGLIFFVSIAVAVIYAVITVLGFNRLKVREAKL
jgi:hypothetical protein